MKFPLATTVNDEKGSEELAIIFAKELQPGQVTVLNGNLGSGKTFFYPFVSLDLGTVIHTLGLPDTSNSRVNFGGSFGIRLRPGFSFNLAGNLGLVISTPITVIAFKAPLITYSPSLTVRYAL